MQERFDEVVEKNGLQGKVVALATDTPSTNKSMWGKLIQKYPKLIAFGCWAHVLQLFLTGM
jgi:hypothetical protein